MEELKKFQSSTFDTIARRRLVEDQDTIVELTGRIQDLQNEINCMSDSTYFQDAESVRSGNSHVTSQPVSFPPRPIPEGLLRPSFVSPRRKEGPPSIWDTHGLSGNLQIQPRLLQHFIHRNWIHGVPVPKSRFIHPQWKRVRGEHKIKKRDASLDSQPKIQSSSVEETLQRFMGQTNNDCRFQIFISTKFTSPSTFACWKIRFKTEVCTCSQFPTEAMQWIKEVELVDSVDDLRPFQRKNQSGRPRRPRSRTVFFEEDRLLTWSTNTSGSLEPTILLRTLPTCSLLIFEMTIFRNSIRSGTEFYCPWRKIPHDDILEGLYKLRIRESQKLKTVLELYDLEIHQKKTGSDYENFGEEKYRARYSK